ncbi:hypothetical protein HWV62_29589 [Athelia sp. TMB]|nr:hypothetical protein HWV62_29589 [Athelia sp. TMB]
MLQFLESKLYSDVEGTCSGQFGYIIAVVHIIDIGKGMVLSGSGQAEFITRYRAIVFKPFKGEVVDGVVNNVNKVRPHNDLYSIANYEHCSVIDGVLCGSWTLDNIRLTSGACAILPQNATLSNTMQLIHPDMKFDPNSNPPSFASDEQIIEKNTRVRLKIVGTRVDATEIFAIGTIKEDHLGVID